jgi:hypothetical protein
VEQYLNLIEEWQLRQHAKLPPPSMWKIAVWTGAAGRHEYELDIPNGSWQIFHTNEGAGLLQIQVYDEKNELAVAANNDKPGTGLSWLHTSGKAKITINALDTNWRVEVYCEAIPGEKRP